ncbi:hypothetical protein [Tenacibaculum agarivorans]|uniref:hypothetical protein n=1 Tax=Tenacibaculum agarivorans TaxID=1908389 RepID=UPI00094B9D0C|nr:hypothetical protein [Tenacibaculum agarivorans]
MERKSKLIITLLLLVFVKIQAQKIASKNGFNFKIEELKHNHFDTVDAPSFIMNVKIKKGMNNKKIVTAEIEEIKMSNEKTRELRFRKKRKK